MAPGLGHGHLGVDGGRVEPPITGHLVTGVKTG
jgi:hypothetical protein